MDRHPLLGTRTGSPAPTVWQVVAGLAWRQPDRCVRTWVLVDELRDRQQRPELTRATVVEQLAVLERAGKVEALGDWGWRVPRPLQA